MVKKITNNDEILNYIINSGIIALDDVQLAMEEEKKKQYLENHKYKVFQDKDGRWKTTLPDKNTKNGRRLIAKKSKEKLEETIIDYYKELETNPYKISSEITLEQLYPIWIESRLLEVNSVMTVKKNEQDWNRYYKDSEITHIPMKDLTVNKLRDWAHSMINDYQLDKRAYYNMAVIMKKCFEFVENENICPNVWKNVKINTSKLKKVKKKDNSSQIYFYDEKSKLVNYCMEMFLQRPWGISTLAIPFLFITGMRVGELVALKYEDITNAKIIVQRSEVNNYEYNKDKKCMEYKGKIIVEHTKTEAGVREIPLTKGAKLIIDLIKRASAEYKYYDEGYIFCPNSRRITSNSIDMKLYRYCERINIPLKSAHKIRKTYISQIIKDGIDLDTVCKVSGHVDLKTTFESYLFCLEHEEEVNSKFDEILVLPELECKQM